MKEKSMGEAEESAENGREVSGEFDEKGIVVS